MSNESSFPPVTVIPADGGTWISFHGIPVQIVATGEQTGGTCTISIGESAPGTEVPPHKHTFDEGFYVLDGEMKYTAGNSSRTLQGGEFIQIRAGTAHVPENESGAPSRQLVICAPSGFDDFQREIGKKVDGPDGPFPASEPADQQRMEEVASKHGIDLRPSKEDFEVTPDIAVRLKGEGRTVAAVGDVYRFLVTGEDTGNRYALWHGTIFPGAGPPPHRHTREEEVFYILEGELTLFDNGKEAKAGPGTTVILPRESRHWFRNDTESPVRMLLLVAPAGLENMFLETGLTWDASNEEAPPPPDAEAKAALGKVAPEYGIVLG